MNVEKIKKLKSIKIIRTTFNFLMTTLLISFIVMKLTGGIDWSWWLVLSPIWIIPVTLLSITILLTLYDVIFKK